MSILDIIQQQLGAGGTQQIANQIGADPSTTQSAIQAAIPMILGGMAGNARQPGGASAISSMLGQAGGLGGMLGGLMGGGGGGIGGMLGGLLGQHQDIVQQGVQQASGLSGGQTGQLLASLAPMVLAAIAGQQGRSGQAMAGAESGGAADLDGNGIPDILEQHAREAAQSSPAAGGFLNQILGSL